MQKIRGLILSYLCRIFGLIEKFFFDIWIKIEFGSRLVCWAKENQDRIDRISKRWKLKYLAVYGKPFDWRKKSIAFERAVKKRNPFMDEIRISKLREQVWTYRNWDDIHKRAAQKQRIEQEGIVSFLKETEK